MSLFVGKGEYSSSSCCTSKCCYWMWEAESPNHWGWKRPLSWESNLWPITTLSTRSQHWVSCPVIPSAAPGMMQLDSNPQCQTEWAHVCFAPSTKLHSFSKMSNKLKQNQTRNFGVPDNNIWEPSKALPRRTAQPCDGISHLRRQHRICFYSSAASNQFPTTCNTTTQG